jgi:hypothetical protein
MIISRKTIACLSLSIVLAAAFEVAQAKEMYSWTDENGTVHFSDTKPVGQDFKTESLPEETQAAPTAQSPQAAVAETVTPGQQRREEIAQKNRLAREDQAARMTQCATWKAEVDQLEPNRRVFTTNEDGETERMDDVERTNRVAQLKAQIARDCN